MNSRIAWTISAVLLVGMFFAARAYVSMMLDEEETTTTTSRVKRPANVVAEKKDPRKTPIKRPEKKKDPLRSLKDLTGRVLALEDAPSDDRADVVADAHTALAEVDGLTIEWTPEVAKDAMALFDMTERAVVDLKNPPADVHAHVLAARVALAEKAGAPDAEAAKRLADMEASNPGAFTWR